MADQSKGEWTQRLDLRMPRSRDFPPPIPTVPRNGDLNDVMLQALSYFKMRGIDSLIITVPCKRLLGSAQLIH